MATEPMTSALNPEEQADRDRILTGLYEHGYVDLDEYVYPVFGERLHVGARIRHVGDQWWKARRHGTGVVVALTEKPASSWSKEHRKRDIELVAQWDNPRNRGRFSQLAQYHIEVIRRDCE